MQFVNAAIEVIAILSIAKRHKPYEIVVSCCGLVCIIVKSADLLPLKAFYTKTMPNSFAGTRNSDLLLLKSFQHALLALHEGL